MINQTSSSNGIKPLGPEQSRPRPSSTRGGTAPADSVATVHAENLRAALSRTPEIRPEVVARARELAVDPNYPPRAIIDDIAKVIAAAEETFLEE